MSDAQMRTWAEIDLGRLKHNYTALREQLAPGCRFVGVVKANAYGHGAVPVAQKLEEWGADYLRWLAWRRPPSCGRPGSAPPS